MTRLGSSAAPLLMLTLGALACDPPPDENPAEVDTSRDGDGNTIPLDTGTHVDGIDSDDTPGATTCIEGVMCLIGQPLNVDACLEGMDAETREDALAVGACAFQNCLESFGNENELLACLVTSCTAESLGCITGGLGGIGF